MNTQIRTSQPGSFTPSPLQMSTNDVTVPSPLKHSAASSHHRPADPDAYTPDRRSTGSIYSSANNISSLSERLREVDFESPAKIFQNKHAIHQFENVTPDVSAPGTPAIAPSTQFGYDSAENNASSGAHTPRSQHSPSSAHTPRSASPEYAEDGAHHKHHHKHHHHHHASAKPSHPATEASSATDYTSSSARPASAIGSATISRTSTPAQFVFKKPEYNSHYHHTHFHHLEKKDTIFHDLKRFFKKNQDKKKKKHLLDDTSSVRSSGSSVYSRQSDLSFANEFNKNLEGRYGKWGEFI